MKKTYTQSAQEVLQVLGVGADGLSTAEALRRQLKDYLDEAAKAKNEASELRRQLFKLQQNGNKR